MTKTKNSSGKRPLYREGVYTSDYTSNTAIIVHIMAISTVRVASAYMHIYGTDT